MIPEITKSNNLSAILEYHESKVEAGEGQIIYDPTFKNTEEGRHEILNDRIRANDKVTKNKVMHLSVSFNPNDNEVSSEDIKSITDDYMKELGYNDTPFIIYEHFDTNHQHFHVVAATIDSDGKKIDDYEDYLKSEITARKIEKEFNLVATEYIGTEAKNIAEINAEKYKTMNGFRSAIVKDMNKELSALLGPIKFTQLTLLDNKTGSEESITKTLGKTKHNDLINYLDQNQLLHHSKKHLLIRELEDALAKTTDRQEYIDIVKSKGIYIRYLRNKNAFEYGNKDRDLYIKEKFLPMRFQHKYIHKVIPVVTHSPEKQKQYLRTTLKKSLYQSTSMKEFEAKISLYNVKKINHSNSSGIYGVSFQSNNASNPTIFKGSDLGKAFTYNNLIKKFNETLVIPKHADTPPLAVIDSPKMPSMQKPVLGKLLSGLGRTIPNAAKPNDQDNQQQRKRNSKRKSDDNENSPSI